MDLSKEFLKPFCDNRNDPRYNAAPKEEKRKYKDWELVKWEGNPSLKMICWVKSFGRGKVRILTDGQCSVDFGPNSDLSMSAGFERDKFNTIEAVQKAVDLTMPGYLLTGKWGMPKI